MAPLYTFVIRSVNRVFEDASRPTSDFRVRLPYQPDLAKHDYWRVSVARVIFPSSDAYITHFDAGQDVYTQPSNHMIYTHEFLEIRLDFGSACKGYDSSTGGGRFVHFVTCDAHPSAQQRIGSTQADAITYEIARPNLGELHVQVVNKDGQLAGMMQNSNFPSSEATAAGALHSSESALPEWFMVLHVEPIEKNVYE